MKLTTLLYRLLFVALLSLFINVLSSAESKAYLEGRTTVTPQITSNRQPAISGTIPTWCNDVAVVITTDTANGSDGSFYYFSDYGQVQLSNGNWTLYLTSVGLGLVNGVYNIAVFSECDYSGSYADPLYADYHYDAIRIVPQSCDAYCVPVYRFYNTQNGAHFYTTTEHEKRSVMETPQYKYEGIVAFSKSFRSDLPGMISVHRFYNYRQGVHFYTANQSEASYVNDNLQSTFRYEGVAYQAYPSQSYDTNPVHRFYKFNQGVHFYTANQSEASYINAYSASTYRYEGVTYYLTNNTN